jgi:hypothetical protein
MRRLVILSLLAGCTVADEVYPTRWDPLPTAESGDCSAFRGRYADRGESPSNPSKPSLTRELFGHESPWEKAASITLEPDDDTLDIRVELAGAKPFSRRLTRKAGEFKCERGALIVRSRRWVTSDLMSGRENVTVEMHFADPYLMARVDETTIGVMFMVVPLSGESARWFRFRRLVP